ncbi:MAG: TonB family protein [Bacteroidales bacterium]|nr:TonB family protein [Bacteroidales bacterium]MBR2227208.1 TonB family protein [Bacteroidales bacterium]
MGKRFLFAAACLLLSTALSAQFRTGSGAFDDLYDSETVHALKEHVSYLSSAALEGRKAGSEGEKDAAEYVARALEKYGVDLVSPVTGQEFSIAREGADTLVSRNVIGFIPGWDKSLNDSYIVVGARLDNLGMDTYLLNGEPTPRIYYGANGNASGLAMLLELASRLSTNRVLLRRNVLIVAFGASQETLAGSWYFLNRSFSDVDHIDAMVNLDMLGTLEHGFYAYTSSNEDLNQGVRALQGELLPVQATLSAEEPYTSDHRAFYDREIPSILFTTGRYPEHGTGRDSFDIVDFDGMERELEYIYTYTVALCNGIRPLFRQDSGKAPAPVDGAVSWNDVDIKPIFLTSNDPSYFLEKWVYQYLKYPKYAVENGIQGRVYVDFVIDESGNVKDVKVSRSVHTALDEEAVRVVSASPKWKPGRHRGKKVKVAMTIPVDFRLEKNTKSAFGINGKRIK